MSILQALLSSGGGPPVFVEWNTSMVDRKTSGTVTLGGQAIAGDRIYYVSMNNSANDGKIGGTPSGFTSIGTQIGDVDSHSRIAVKTAVGGETTITASLDSGTRYVLFVFVVRNINTTLLSRYQSAYAEGATFTNKGFSFLLTGTTEAENISTPSGYTSLNSGSVGDLAWGVSYRTRDAGSVAGQTIGTLEYTTSVLHIQS
jgi:hypothetical protein